MRPLPRNRLPDLVPSLLEAQGLVAVVPVTSDLAWAARVAWDVARAATGWRPAAADYRRVALVDLWLDQAHLHEPVGLEPGQGIVDAFERDAPLTETARQVDRVFFIGAGSATARAGEVLAHPRWPRLHAGFRSEGALLLLYLSPAALGRLSATPDGVLVLAPEGFELESAAGRQLAAVVERGVPVLGVVRERWTPRPAPRARCWRPATVALGLALAGGASWALFARSAERPSGARAAPVAANDSLSWTVQLAAYGTFQNAVAYADELGGYGVAAFVAPVVPDATGPVWYRVLVGSYATREEAAGAREQFWGRGIAPRGQGDLLRAPYSFAIGQPSDLDSLRALGFPAIRRSREGRTVLFGAFETPEQAAFAAGRLSAAGVRATLITRMGTTP